MGLIFYNVMKNWNPQTEHILTVQKFSQIETDMLRQLSWTSLFYFVVKFTR